MLNVISQNLKLSQLLQLFRGPNNIEAAGRGTEDAQSSKAKAQNTSAQNPNSRFLFGMSSMDAESLLTLLQSQLPEQPTASSTVQADPQIPQVINNYDGSITTTTYNADGSVTTTTAPGISLGTQASSADQTV